MTYMKPIIVTIREEPMSGIVRVGVEVESVDGSSHVAASVSGYTRDRKIEAVLNKVEEILQAMDEDGTLEV